MTNLELIKQKAIVRILESKAEDFAAKYALAHDCANCCLNDECDIYDTTATDLHEQIKLFNSCTKKLKKWLESEVEED